MTNLPRLLSTLKTHHHHSTKTHKPAETTKVTITDKSTVTLIATVTDQSTVINKLTTTHKPSVSDKVTVTIQVTVTDKSTMTHVATITDRSTEIHKHTITHKPIKPTHAHTHKPTNPCAPVTVTVTKTVPASDVKPTPVACQDGAYQCADPGKSNKFTICSNGKLVHQACAPGTVCRTFGQSIICDWA
ncbi:hypothetical protein K7432_016943 [Basidiobolus ranarum]|uniref:Chitin-binding type-2 domain-containing protein n=1 Tax=Basidiobolus ranarum TaxID=34480 RepID=A0ABR2WE12_9FUNG